MQSVLVVNFSMLCVRVFLLAALIWLTTSQDCPKLGAFSPFALDQTLNGSSLTKCTFNGLQCCSQFTITLFERGLDLGINGYAPNFLSGFDAAQKVIDELRSINKAIIPHIAEDIIRPLLLSAVSSPSPYFTAAVNNTMTDIISALNGSTINVTVTFYEYIKAVAFYQLNKTVDHLSTETNISGHGSIRDCINLAIHSHVHNEMDSVVELIKLLQNISTAINILKQLPPLYDKLLGSFQSVKFTDTCLDVFSSNFLCPLCRNQPSMCPGRCKEIITGCASPLNQAIVQLDASFRLILSIAKGLIGSSSSVTNSINISRIPSLCGRLIATVKESILLDSDFQKALNSCGIAVQSPSQFSKRSSNEQVTVKHKRATGVPDVGINASFFDEFERKLNLLGGNIINTVKDKFCNPTFGIEYSGLSLQITAENGMCSYGVGNVGTYNSTFVREDIAVQTFNNPAGRFNYTQLFDQARNQTYIITELFDNSDISPTVFNIFLPDEAFPTTDFLSVTVPIDLSTVTTTNITPTKTQSSTLSTIPVISDIQTVTDSSSVVIKTSPGVVIPTIVMKPRDGSAIVYSYSMIIMLGCSMLAMLL